MAAAYERRKTKLARKGIYAGTEDVTDYRIRTPLQQSIMILKPASRHHVHRPQR
jgi:hypothetical protein